MPLVASCQGWHGPRKNHSAQKQQLKCDYQPYGDSGGAWFKANGGRHLLEPLLRAIGFTNIIFEVIHGGTPKEYEEIISAYVQAHSEFLIENAVNHGVLPHPPGFNLLLLDNMNALTTQQGLCKQT